MPDNFLLQVIGHIFADSCAYETCANNCTVVI